MAVAVVVSIVGLLSAAPVAAQTQTPSPFVSRPLYVDPNSAAARDAGALEPSDPVTAALIQEIADQPQADWFGDWVPVDQVRSSVASRVDVVVAAGAYPVLVIYDIPRRDCGSFSSGGAGSAEEYERWVREFRLGIGSRPAAVVLEPDALAQLDCLSASDQTQRLALLRSAIQVLAYGGNIAVYLDAGHSGWVSPGEMARRLAKAGIAHARGFSLNVSAFGTTAGEVAYGSKIAPLVGWKRFVIDTSRNGNGAATTGEVPSCNPPGRALGARPSAHTESKLVDALLWIKRPGESDGTCRGGPPAGTWWRDYAIGLVRRAAR
jgi:endoglucanase